eukprot:TRINITY_DN31_c5_g1_i2.p1 TRINITY_DN31_c5_g1~~TRINITY_DN31_c5_g1_i2.p1  ORF type:complete len:116 (+),score=25.38 TRINITY_DN31_c5_g1_i2:84-431(+)
MLILSEDGQLVEVDPAAAQLSGTLRSYLSDTPEGTQVPLPNVRGKQLRKCFEYCDYFKAAPPADTDMLIVPENLRLSPGEEWAQLWISAVSQSELFDLILVQPLSRCSAAHQIRR